MQIETNGNPLLSVTPALRNALSNTHLPSQLKQDLRHSAEERQQLLDRTKAAQDKLIRLVSNERERRETGRERRYHQRRAT